ncbi:hypothetical protein V5O48_014502, partial [Marasmius crinis-equi]
DDAETSLVFTSLYLFSYPVVNVKPIQKYPTRTLLGRTGSSQDYLYSLSPQPVLHPTKSPIPERNSEEALRRFYTRAHPTTISGSSSSDPSYPMPSFNNIDAGVWTYHYDQPYGSVVAHFEFKAHLNDVEDIS